MSARYQNPMTSRWMSADPSLSKLINPMERNGQGKLDLRSNFNIIESINPYSYCGNNPIGYRDPTGKEGITISGLALFGIAVGIVATVNIIKDHEEIGDAFVGASKQVGDFVSDIIDNVTKSEERPSTDDNEDADDENTPEVLPSPEELEAKIKENQKKVEDSIPTTEVPNGLPEDQKPELKDPKGMKAAKIFLKIMEVLTRQME